MQQLSRIGISCGSRALLLGVVLLAAPAPVPAFTDVNSRQVSVWNDSPRTDSDADGVFDSDLDGTVDPCTGGVSTDCDDNCPLSPNPNQEDVDADGIGDACDPADGFSVDVMSRQVSVYNDTGDRAIRNVVSRAVSVLNDFPRTDTDGDGVPDTDLDGTVDPCTGGETTGCDDNCPLSVNPDQADADSDGIGDACDASSFTDVISRAVSVYNDTLDVSTRDVVSRAVSVLNDFPRTDTDGDGVPDTDLDGTIDPCTSGETTDCDDNCPLSPNPDQVDADGDGVGDACDANSYTDVISRSVSVYNDTLDVPIRDVVSRQVSLYNGLTPIDPDLDGIPTSDYDNQDDPCASGQSEECDDNCPGDFNPAQTDCDSDGVGDACDPDFVDSDQDGTGDFCDLPETRRVAPGDNALDVSVWANTIAWFTEPVDAGTVGDSNGDGTLDSFVLLVDGVLVPAAIDVSADGLNAVYDPLEALPVDTLVEARLTADIRDLQGEAIPAKTWFFRTAATADPNEQSLDPEDLSAGDQTGEQLGTDISGVGDINRDGFDDWIVGAPGFDRDGSADTGRALLYFGTDDENQIDVPDIIFEGVPTQGFAGISVDGGQDVDGDGTLDIVIGAEAHDGLGAFGTGQAYVVLFDPADYPNYNDPFAKDTVLIDDVADVTLQGVASGDRAGRSVALVADVNGDGLAEILVGAPGADRDGTADRGEAYLVYGQASLPSTISLADVGGAVDGVTYVGEAAFDGLGWSVEGGRDVDCDGTPDVVIGAPYIDGVDEATDAPIPNIGGAFIDFDAFKRGITDIGKIGGGGSGNRNGVSITGDRPDMQAGFAVDLAADQNGDLCAEALCGAPGSDASGFLESGEVFILAGGDFGPDGGTVDVAQLRDPLEGLGASVQGAESAGQLGRAVAAGGDVNGDGIGDTLMGAPGLDSQDGLSADVGAAIVDLGAIGTRTFGTVSVSELGVTRPGAAYYGESAGDAAGSALSGAGDASGDGKDDFTLGAPKRDAGATADAGAAYLVTDDPDPFADGPTPCGPEGCTVTDLDSGSQIDVPAGALSEEVAISVEAKLDPAQLPLPPPPGTELLAAASYEPIEESYGDPEPRIYVSTRVELDPQISNGELFDLFRFEDASWVDTGIDGSVSQSPYYPETRKAVGADVARNGLYAFFYPDLDGDGTRDENDLDDDGDAIGDGSDNCPRTFNPDQLNGDGDARGDVCDPCPADALDDEDGDGLCCPEDNCCSISNASQADLDGDGQGDACEALSVLRVSSDPAESPDFFTIQAAVDAAPAPRASLLVSPGLGPYFENVVVDRSITLTIAPDPAYPGTVVLDGGGGLALNLLQGASTPHTLAGITLRGSRGVETHVDAKLRDVALESIGALGIDLRAGSLHAERIGADDTVAAGISSAAGSELTLERSRFVGLGDDAIEIAGSASLTNVVVSDGSGHGVIVRLGGTARVDHATVSGNANHGILDEAGGVSDIRRSIIWANTSGDLSGVACALVRESNVGTPDCSATNGNISNDPLLDAQFGLSSGSPCLEFAESSASYDGTPCLDVESGPRLEDFDGDGIARRDIGAYEMRDETLAPPPVSGLAWDATGTMLSWDALAGASRYHVYRVDVALLSYALEWPCRDDLDTDLTDTELEQSQSPPPGSAWAYVISAESTREGALGYGTCAERSNWTTCP